MEAYNITRTNQFFKIFSGELKIMFLDQFASGTTKDSARTKAKMASLRKQRGPTRKTTSRPISKATLLKLYKKAHNGNPRSMSTDKKRRTKKLLDLTKPRVRRSLRKNPARLRRADVPGLDDGSQK